MKKAHVIHVESKSIVGADDALVKAFNEWSFANSSYSITMICEPHRWVRYPTGDTSYCCSLTFFYE